MIYKHRSFIITNDNNLQQSFSSIERDNFSYVYILYYRNYKEKDTTGFMYNYIGFSLERRIIYCSNNIYIP